MPDSPAPLAPPRGGLLRFSVRWLMLLVAVIAAVLGWVTYRARVQRDAVAAIVLGGGSVEYDYQVSKSATGDYVFNSSARPRWPRWLFDALGPDHLATVVRVHLGQREPDRVLAQVGRLRGLESLAPATQDVRVTDAGMVHLRALRNLEALDLSFSSITGASLVNLREMTRLRVLNLPRGMPATDADLASLSALTALQELDLSGSPDVSDAGLVHLEALVNLRSLVLEESKVTGDGLAHLRGLARLENLDLAYTRVESLARLGRLPRLTRLNLSETPIDDAGLAPMSEFKQLQRLLLFHTRVGDAGLAHLNRLENLDMLFLTGDSAITDAGLAHLAKLDHLSTLALEGTGVTDACIDRLARLKGLRRLDLPRGVSRRGVAALRGPRPDLNVTAP